MGASLSSGMLLLCFAFMCPCQSCLDIDTISVWPVDVLKWFSSVKYRPQLVFH